MSKGRIAASVAGFAALAASITTAALVTSSSDPAGAAELEQFASCAELGQWSSQTMGAAEATVTRTDDGDEAMAAGDAAAIPSPAGAAEQSSVALADTAEGTGGTNTVVAGVDEIDVMDRVGDTHIVVARNGALALIDLTNRAVVDQMAGMPFDARVSVDGETIWVVGSALNPEGPASGSVVHRLTVSGDDLIEGEQWTTPGWVLDARRTGDRLHLVAVDYPQAAGGIAFDGGPVPCDQVWRPVDPATSPAATLVATFDASGPLEPTAVAEIVGAGSNILVTQDAVFVATETYGGGPASGEVAGEVSTGLHRFDLATLAPTGSGRVPGTLAGPFALDEFDSTLRVATSLQLFGRPVPLDGVVSSDDAIAPPEPAPEDGPEALGEVFVLDTDGDLDLLGRTGRFGHDGETIQGVRFVGETAYVVTFLNTDPFWVIDLADPAAPAIAGELEIPGFSAYLHPLDETLVVGFGPDGAGRVAARLFDVSDPAAPAVVDEIGLGDDSPVAWDHKAFVALDGGAFAVPFNDFPDYVAQRCAPAPVPLPVPLPEPLPTEPGIGDGSGGGGSGGAGGGGVDSQPSPLLPPEGEICEPVATGGAAGVVVLTTQGGDLVTVERPEIATDGAYSAERAILTPDGAWLLLAWDRLLATDGGDPIPLPSDPSAGGGPVVIE